ncbi:hypothetical protein G7054_g5278 [Neopestalotiopsis clavispora]|nr:hypothetical protein G7054_g5278 [Neopestalotiopsis clavispora]
MLISRPQNSESKIGPLWRKTLRGKLFLSPIEKLDHVLDIGTGTALTHANSQVIGTDLSPIQPSYIPTNCQFEIDDAEDEWLYRQKFSLIHSRGNHLSFQSPETVVSSAFNALARHGWFESQDIVLPLKCDDNSWEGSSIQRWNNVIAECFRLSGRRSYVEDFAQMFRDVGLDNVTERLFVWPVSPWPQGPRNQHLRELSQIARRNLLEGLEAFSMVLFTRYANMSKDEVLTLVQNAKDDFWDPKYHVYMQVVVTMGQKP